MVVSGALRSPQPFHQVLLLVSKARSLSYLSTMRTLKHTVDPLQYSSSTTYKLFLQFWYAVPWPTIQSYTSYANILRLRHHGTFRFAANRAGCDDLWFPPHFALGCLSLCYQPQTPHWTQGTERFAAEILKSKIVAYEQAVDLAITEERLEVNAAASADTRPLFQKHIGRLLRNAELAESAATGLDAWLSSFKMDKYRRKLNFTYAHASYYLLRKLVLAYRHPEARLQTSLLLHLRTSSEETLHIHASLDGFLAGGITEEERIRHGMPKPEEDWAPEDEYAVRVDLDEWVYAGAVVWSALTDHMHGTAKLEPTINSVFKKA